MLQPNEFTKRQTFKNRSMIHDFSFSDQVSVSVGGFDFTSCFKGLEMSLPLHEPESAVIWSGSLTLALTVAAVQAGVTAADLDPLENAARWAPGLKSVVLTIGNYATLKMRIKDWSYDDQSGVANGTLGQQIELYNQPYPELDSDTVYSDPANPVFLKELIARLIAAVGTKSTVPFVAGQPSTDEDVFYGLRSTRSPISEIQGFAKVSWSWLTQNLATETVDIKPLDYEVSPIAFAVPRAKAEIKPNLNNLHFAAPRVIAHGSADVPDDCKGKVPVGYDSRGNPVHIVTETVEAYAEAYGKDSKPWEQSYGEVSTQVKDKPSVNRKRWYGGIMNTTDPKVAFEPAYGKYQGVTKRFIDPTNRTPVVSEIKTEDYEYDYGPGAQSVRTGNGSYNMPGVSSGVSVERPPIGVTTSGAPAYSDNGCSRYTSITKKCWAKINTEDVGLRQPWDMVVSDVTITTYDWSCTWTYKHVIKDRKQVIDTTAAGRPIEATVRYVESSGLVITAFTGKKPEKEHSCLDVVKPEQPITPTVKLKQAVFKGETAVAQDYVPVLNFPLTYNIGYCPSQVSATLISKRLAARETMRKHADDVTLPLPIEWLRAGCPHFSRCVIGRKVYWMDGVAFSISIDEQGRQQAGMRFTGLTTGTTTPIPDPEFNAYDPALTSDLSVTWPSSIVTWSGVSKAVQL